MGGAKVEQDFYPLQGGLDLMTPAITIDPGKCFDAQNYEPQITGGYRRIDGYERFDGHQSPSSGQYALIIIAQTGPISIGATLTGQTSGASCRVLQLTPSFIVSRLSGIFLLGENLLSPGVVGSITSLPQVGAAPASSDDANYTLLAANDLRLDISAVPGSGTIRGVKLYKNKVYAFRDNLLATAGLMYVATSTGWSPISFGSELQLTTLVKSGVVTITSAAPGVVTWSAHGMVNGQPVQLSSTALLPTGLAANFTYYVIAATTNTFELSATLAGTAITTTSTGTGTISCTASGNNIYAGNTVTGVTSGATALVSAALLRTGSWTTNLVGNLVLTSIVGTFNASEILTIGGLMYASTSSTAIPIVRMPGGKMEFCNINFTGSATGQKMYGVDGINPAFEFDGANYVPLHTGSVPDAPSHVINFKEMLLLAISGNLIIGAIGNPYNYDAINGAGDIGVGDLITGFVPNGGTYITGSTMSIFTERHLYTMYGSSTANFNLITSIWDMGFAPFTMQAVSNDTYGWTSRGIQALITTLTFGDFSYNSISHEIQSLVNAKQGMAIASNSLHAKDQYRVYFSDGTALAFGLTGGKPNGIMPLNYVIPVSCICTDNLLNGGIEVTYFGSTNGFVYQDSIGTSQDGASIEAWIRLAFNDTKSPRIRKRYRRAVFEGVVSSYTLLNISYDIGYGSPDVQTSAPSADVQINGGGGYWDQFTWSEFTWDSQVVATPQISLEGTEKNISFLIYSNYAQCQSHTMQGVTVCYSPRRIER